MTSTHSPTVSGGSRTWGLIAEFAGPEELKAAARTVREAGYTRIDAHSPFPIHGIDPALGIRPTRLPWIVLAFGISGLIGGLALQLWANGFAYAWNISGKPIFSVPANIPITFEATVLLSAFACFFGTLIANQAGSWYQPMLTSERFRRATQDAFFLSIEATDPRFSSQETVALVRAAGAREVEVLATEEGGERSKFPRALATAVFALIGLTFVPLAVAANMRVTTMKEPRIHVVPDMDKQMKYKAQATNTAFPDQRADRAPVAGTIARGEHRSANPLFYTGKIGEDFSPTFPPEVPLTAATMARGQERFNIYCTPCHGLVGEGDGMVALRAAALGHSGWVPPTNLQSDPVRAHPPGRLFDIITHGIRNMRPYATQITEADRWAIALYMRALQRSQHANLADVPEALRGKLN